MSVAAFPFFCKGCNKICEGKTDIVALIFSDSKPMVTCLECGHTYKSDVTVEFTQEELDAEDEPSANS